MPLLLPTLLPLPLLLLMIMSLLLPLLLLLLSHRACTTWLLCAAGTLPPSQPPSLPLLQLLLPS
jgi:hypothetical protein